MEISVQFKLPREEMTPSSITVGTPVATLSVPDAVPPPLFGLPRVDDGVMASLLPKKKPKGETNSDTDRNAPITASIDRAVCRFGKRRSDRCPTGRCHAVLDGLAAKNLEKFDWRHSIVDLMKLVGMDSSLNARKQLATELHYSGDQNDSASTNIWLHKEIIQKIAENGGKVPQDLLK